MKDKKLKEKIKCDKCNYEWETKSTLKFATCPSCRLKVEVLRENVK